jgi:hypothetical protein
MLLRSLFRNLSLYPSCYLRVYRSIPLLRPLVCSRSTLPIHLLRSISSVSDPLHFPLCFWIFFPIPLLLFLLFSYFPIPIFPKRYTIVPVFFHCVFNTSSCFFFNTLSPFTTWPIRYLLRSACFSLFSYVVQRGSGVLSPIHGPAEVPSFEKILPLRWDSNPLAPGPRPRSTVSDSHAATKLLVLFISLLYIVIIFHHFFPCILLLPFLVAFL